MSGLTYDQLAAKVGTAFDVASPAGEQVLLRLRLIEPLGDSGRPGGSFRLEFAGPAAIRLPQSIYSFVEVGADPLEIFIVPIAQESDQLIYEAVFF